jgi:hypothetical protein
MIQIKYFVFRICNKSLWQRNEPMAKERAGQNQPEEIPTGSR